MTAKLTPTERAALTEEAIKRFGRGAAPAAPLLNQREVEKSHAFMAALHEKQFLVATCGAKRIAVITPRRWGKTTLLQFLAMRAVREYPGATIPYIGLDRLSAKRLFWKPLKDLNRQYGLNLEFNETELMATAPNGAVIWLLGAKDTDDIEKLRGDKYPLAMIDESASFKPHIEAMVQEVIEPALGDYDGTLILVGTPGRTPAGFFYEVTTGLQEGWWVYRGTAYDNTKFPQWVGKPNFKELVDAYLAKTAKRYGGQDSPGFRREYLGEWVQDTDVQVYRFNPAINTYDALPDNREWLHILGIDFGYDPDPSAFSVIAFSPHDLTCYVRETFAATGMLADDISAKVRELDAKYGPFIARIGDPAAKQFFMELNQRKGLAIQPAEKKQKLDFIELMNNDFRSGHIKVKSNDLLADEYKRLVWNDERTAEHPSRPNHCADATLYAWRKSKHWAGKAAEEKPAAGSTEAQVIQFRHYLEQAEKAAKARLEDELEFDYGF